MLDTGCGRLRIGRGGLGFGLLAIGFGRLAVGFGIEEDGGVVGAEESVRAPAGIGQLTPGGEAAGVFAAEVDEEFLRAGVVFVGGGGAGGREAHEGLPGGEWGVLLRHGWYSFKRRRRNCRCGCSYTTMAR